jgi:formylglycine-generating enzyme required for sulfatase activity
VAQFCESVAKNPSLAVVQTLAEAYQGTPMGSCAAARVEELKSQIAKVVAPPVMPAVPSSPCSARTVGVSLSSRQPCPLSAAEERSLRPKDTFKECADCPEMVVVPAGTFAMGSPASEKGRYNDEGPQHDVTFRQPFAVGKFELTFDEWDACVADGGCNRYRPSDEGWGRGRRPVIYVAWDDANAYVAWVAKKTGEPYRLLTEAEYEYAARAGTTTVYPWGNAVGQNNANCIGCDSQWNKQTAPVGSFAANGFGLYDMLGNVWEWTEDYYHDSYSEAPADGSAWTKGGDYGKRVLRGGSWSIDPVLLRPAHRYGFSIVSRILTFGFRVGRTLLTP